MKTTKILCLLIVLAMCVAVFAACTGGSNNGTSSDNGAVESGDESGENSGDEVEELPYSSVADQTKYPLSQLVYGEDYTELYNYVNDSIGVSIDMVYEDADTGLAYIVLDDVRYDLGMDFLSMAMVYNVEVPEDGEWETEDDVYATWWKYYITRWNYLLPEIPLYSNEYYDVYNAQIKGVEEHPTNPYWSPASALIDWKSEKADKSIILGNTTELSGRFRVASWGVSSPGAADLDIQNLITGLETISSTKEGGYVVNETVVEDLTEADNEDGSHTYTVKIAKDLKFSDGSAITAKNYIVYALMASTEAATQAKGTGMGGYSFVGFEEFAAAGEPTPFSGIRLIDDYTFSVTVKNTEYPYYYAITYAGFSPYPLSQWIGDADVVDDGEGAYITESFYTKDGEGNYAIAETIGANVLSDPNIPCSGPYMIESFDQASSTATLVVNPNFKGNYEGVKPQIERIVYKRIIGETQLQDFQSGGVDVLSGITGGNETDEALALVEANPDKYVATHYARAGYGKLGFRGDFGPVRFVEVRQAIAYCLDRATFAKSFTGGYGGVVHGPYYTGAWQYKEAVANGMLLSDYPTSVDSAIAVLEAGGWVYNADGSDYSGSGVRYKKLTAGEIDENDLTYQSKDGAYKVEKVGDDYYMPLVINWYGTADNTFTDMLVTDFMEGSNIKAAGFVIQNTIGDFNPMLDELYQGAYGISYSGTPTYNAFNFATGFTSAVYDYSYNWKLDPDWYEDYSVCYIRDAADAYWLK